MHLAVSSPIIFLLPVTPTSPDFEKKIISSGVIDQNGKEINALLTYILGNISATPLTHFNDTVKQSLCLSVAS